ncbi:chromosome segregation protein SMC [Cellulomonas sp. PhB143]|uniref:chromosome segregation protein SMC n=1 Tax=Cellulomonas sp. PhB143 TaxID=2485186 RepID=UPI000F46622C|nr:chromosome segregation protein SMC [Cellulomonas sp. PhB143]ROS77105.1 condensin subunit Smc [Cellulomonas sp. PhB143]
MHLKTLTLRGFKSFASATTLRFEPGVTCVVGPNGSGKSNVVDALSWVMGEQGAKTLRGGKMEDVIFAGTSGRPPLGRAEVSLTIDNTDGALPIEYTEVTISRTLFRNGGSEYAINGSGCRLLDIQDLLSDSGIGREMHVIVGQGRLDAVLRATPEERRGFVEEAAGVLKHRKRKEKALRKLDAMQGNLTRLGDLTSEIRRQLGPLGRQAEVARRAQTVQVDLRDAKARLLADDLVQLTSALEQDLEDEAAVRERVADVEARLAQARARLADLEQDAARSAPEVTRAGDVWYRLSSERERLRSTQSLAEERVRHLGTPGPAHQGRDPEELARQAEAVRRSERELAAELGAAREALDAAVAVRAADEDAARGAEQRLAALVRGAADRREGLARLTGQVAARRSRVEATQAEIGRLREVVTEAERRAETARREFAALETQVVGAEEGEVGLDAAHEEAADALAEATEAVERLRAQESAAERERATWSARVEALELSLERKDGAGALLSGDVAGTLGSVAALVGIEAGYEDAVAAALGSAADAVVVESLDAAVDALRHLRDEDAGRAGLLLAHGPAAGDGPDAPPARDASATGGLPAGARRAADVVQAAPAARAAVERLLADVVVVEDLAQARRLVVERPGTTAVTPAGDLLGPDRAWGGSASAPGVLHLQAALDEAREEHAAAVARGERSRFALGGAGERLAAAQERYDATLERLDENDAALAAVAERLGTLGSTARGAAAEADRARANLERAGSGLEDEQEALAALVERLDVAQAEPEESHDAVGAASAERDATATAAQGSRAAETEARLAVRTCEERARALGGRAESLDRAAAAERAARVEADRREQQRVVRADRARAVLEAAQVALGAIDASITRAADAKAAAEEARARRDVEAGRARADADALTGELRDLTDVAHRDELARAQQRMRIEQLEARVVEELGTDPAVLVEEFGPHRPVPVPGADPDAPGDGPAEVAYVRAEQEKRLRSAERALRTLGRVNPLALEEFAALEERHTFLTTQLADLKKSRADLLEIVREIDERVEQVFASAFADTADQFERVFARMFPGGEGRLVLTDPSDMLTTGIEVEARPAGKKVKRLSLLSGGERSLTAVAILVSIFKARPSPFYVMDEVEAALDDVNLGRLLEIFTELQQDSQLIVITHQKRTMEVADALYGVTMRGDGVTTVISQRMRAEQPA